MDTFGRADRAEEGTGHADSNGAFNNDGNAGAGVGRNGLEGAFEVG